MKKILLSSFAVFVVFVCRAQIKKGDLLLGGNIGYSNQTTKSDPYPYSGADKNSSLYLAPSFGLAVRDNLVLGLDLTYNHQKVSYVGPSSSTTTNSYGGGVFLRKYKYLGSGFYIFGQSRLALSSYHQDVVNGEPSNTQSNQDGYNISLGFYPGVAFAISRHWQIETGFPNIGYISYDHEKTVGKTAGQPDSKTSTNTFNVSSSLSNAYQFSVGLRYIMRS